MNSGVRSFFFKEAYKIWTLKTNFSKVPTKKEPFGFHFSKGADKNLRVRNLVIFGGQRGRGRGGGIKNGTSPNTQLPTFIELGICQIQPSRFSDKHIFYSVLSSPAVLIHILLVSRQSYSESDDVQSYLKKKYTL